MAHPSKRKGNRFERELVHAAQAAGVEAERAYASNGRALGECEEVDLLLGGLRVQAKRRKRVAGYIKPPAGCDVTAVREDRGESLCVVPLPLLLDLLKRAA